MYAVIKKTKGVAVRINKECSDRRFTQVIDPKR